MIMEPFAAANPVMTEGHGPLRPGALGAFRVPGFRARDPDAGVPAALGTRAPGSDRRSPGDRLGEQRDGCHMRGIRNLRKQRS